jgi:predicted MFS family arabinose efflux permease
MIGSLIGGYIAERSLTHVFWFAGALAIAAAVLFMVAFAERTAAEPPGEPEIAAATPANPATDA